MRSSRRAASPAAPFATASRSASAAAARLADLAVSAALAFSRCFSSASEYSARIASDFDSVTVPSATSLRVSTAEIGGCAAIFWYSSGCVKAGSSVSLWP